MTIRARLTLTSAVLLVGTVTSACGGGGGAPSDASKDGFCEAANSLMSDLMPEDLSTAELPSDQDMAQAVKDWGSRMEEVDASDFSMDNLEDLEQGGADASAEEKKQAEAFGTYLTDTCGNPMDDIEMPEMPEIPESTN
jgi:hypothetical protein